MNKVVNVTNVTNYNNGWHGGWWGAVSPIWWGFGYYSIGPGWYAPGYIYPNYWYWNGWAGYRVEHRPDSKHVSGLRIELVGVKDKKKREEAEKGIVQLSRDAGATWSVIGSVKRLMDHTYPLDPGNYAVKIVFAGKNRELDMTIEVEKGIPTYTPIVFDEPTSTTAQPAPQGPPTPPKS